MGQTANHAFPYPELTDPADVPADVRALAEAVDAVIPTTPVIPPGEGGFVTVPVLDVGLAGQNRAGRQLAAADFTTLGLSAPRGLWNLSGTSDASGNARTLTNKGTVPFGVGINAQATTSAVFAGSTAQALYIDDTGVNDPLRIRTGSWGAWIRTAKRATEQACLSKYNGATNQRAYVLGIWTTNVAECTISSTGTDTTGLLGTSVIADDRWHLVIATFDGTTLRLYVDAVREATASMGALIFSSTAPLNIGGTQADAATAAGLPFYGRVDEAFVTSDVLSDAQIRSLYATRLPHTLGIAPSSVRVNVRRKRKGGRLTAPDFPTQPVRLHNFTAGALTDEGSGNVALTANPGTGSITAVAGADGSLGNAYSFTGANAGLSATDAGLPSGTNPRSYGCWFKSAANSVVILSWADPANQTRLYLAAGGALTSASAADLITGPVANDGQWHFAVASEDNTAGDGVRRKLYMDGRLVGGSTVLNAIALSGANRFRVGANPDGTTPMAGQIDAAFVSAGALTFEQIATLYAKATQPLAPIPKNPGDHVEALAADSVLLITDTLESQYTVDVGVDA